MQHYFIDKQHSAEDFFDFNDSVLNLDLCFRSCDSIFSKNKIDEGTKAFLKVLDKNCRLEGKGLDLGCGLGAISIVLAKKCGVKLDAIDINNTAVSLAKQNFIKNNVQHNITAFVSNGFEQVEGEYDFIVSNPPIKTGKKILFEMMSDAKTYLKQGAQLLLVIRKDLGMESLKKHLINTFDNCEIIGRDKGYYILKSVKN